MSSLAPDTMKKIGMKIPKAIPSTFVCSTLCSLVGTSCLVMMPAMKAPRTTSRPKSSAIAKSATSRSAVRRTAVCALVSCPRSMTAMTRLVRSRVGALAKTNATAAKSATDSSASQKDLVLRSREIARTGPNSPMAPAPMK